MRKKWMLDLPSWRSSWHLFQPTNNSTAKWTHLRWKNYLQLFINCDFTTIKNLTKSNTCFVYYSLYQYIFFYWCTRDVIANNTKAAINMWQLTKLSFTSKSCGSENSSLLIDALAMQAIFSKHHRTNCIYFCTNRKMGKIVSHPAKNSYITVDIVRFSECIIFDDGMPSIYKNADLLFSWFYRASVFIYFFLLIQNNLI